MTIFSHDKFLYVVLRQIDGCMRIDGSGVNGNKNMAPAVTNLKL
jgi:hypothetical protein